MHARTWCSVAFYQYLTLFLPFVTNKINYLFLTADYGHSQWNIPVGLAVRSIWPTKVWLTARKTTATIWSRDDDDSSSVTDYSDDLTICFFLMYDTLMCFIFASTHVTVCECHTGLKSYLLILLGCLGGTTGSASDWRSEGRGYTIPANAVCFTVGVNCRLWPATTPSSEL